MTIFEASIKNLFAFIVTRVQFVTKDFEFVASVVLVCCQSVLRHVRHLPNVASPTPRTPDLYDSELSISQPELLGNVRLQLMRTGR